MNRFRFLFLLLLGLFAVTVAPRAQAEDWVHTGDSVRVKSVPFLGTFPVYAIGHDMKGRPPTKSKQAMIDADVDKRFVWSMLREVGSQKIKDALTDALKMNGFVGDPRIAQFLAAFNKEDIAKGASVNITYTAASKTTSITVSGAGSARIQGDDFMKAVWKVWFGKIDQPAMGDQLMSKL